MYWTIFKLWWKSIFWEFFYFVFRVYRACQRVLKIQFVNKSLLLRIWVHIGWSSCVCCLVWVHVNCSWCFNIWFLKTLIPHVHRQSVIRMLEKGGDSPVNFKQKFLEFFLQKNGSISCLSKYLIFPYGFWKIGREAKHWPLKFFFQVCIFCFPRK